jgi:hypothetical protein
MQMFLQDHSGAFAMELQRFMSSGLSVRAYDDAMLVPESERAHGAAAGVAQSGLSVGLDAMVLDAMPRRGEEQEAQVRQSLASEQLTPGTRGLPSPAVPQSFQATASGQGDSDGDEEGTGSEPEFDQEAQEHHSFGLVGMLD